MRSLLLLALLITALAGCAEQAEVKPDAARAQSGVIRGVIVDEAIRPIAEVEVLLRQGELTRAATSDSQGRFSFDDVPAGDHFLNVRHLLYHPVQTSVSVEPGRDEPPIVRIQLDRVFVLQPFSEVTKFEGFLQCAWNVAGASSICVNDYSGLVVPGGVLPELRDAVDARGFISSVGGGWKSMVMELIWEPSVDGTAEEMFVLLSFNNRTASDYFAQEYGTSPVVLRVDVGIDHPTGNGEPRRVPADGMPDLYTFAGVEAETAAVAFNQPFTIFQHNFYHAEPPGGWSFAKGDSPPF